MVARTPFGTLATTEQQVGSRVTRVVRLGKGLQALTRVLTLPHGLALTRAWILGSCRHSFW